VGSRNHRVRTRIEEIGIIPSVYASSAEDATFAVRTVFLAGIPIVEISMTVPGALDVIADFARHAPDLIVGADSAWDIESARRAVDAGAMFITSPGFDSRSILEFVIQEDVVVIPGALTPTEVSTAWQAGADFVKVFPCHSMGGPRYIRALRAPFPGIPLVASGGVNQTNAGDFMAAGAAVLGIGTELIPHEAVEQRNEGWITELARRFLTIVTDARSKQLRPIPDRR
jgi:2-dehydro-3-deoxyphosphogluconate aldolase/(4S)-4-hydroxy-2-oxoglutarate aldolase